ncbi:MAG: transporter [Halobacteriales archaeon]
MSVTDRVDARTAGLGAVAGVAAYALGYLVAYVTEAGSIEEQLQVFNVVTELLGGDPIPAWQAVGWLFYNAHFVETSIPAFAGTRTINLLAEGSAAFYLLPPALLVGAGVAVATLADIEEPAPGGAAGALVTLGYLPLAAVGIAVFSYSVGDGTIAPDAITAIGVAGIVYPAVFGAVGGAIGSRARG